LLRGEVRELRSRKAPEQAAAVYPMLGIMSSNGEPGALTPGSRSHNAVRFCEP
jgi:hypothetical protein